MSLPIHPTGADDRTSPQSGGADWNSQMDALVAEMQAPEGAAALARGFSATPAEMATASMAAARRDRDEQQPAQTD